MLELIPVAGDVLFLLSYLFLLLVVVLTGKTLAVTMLNPLGWTRTEIVSLPVPVQQVAGTRYSIVFVVV